MKNSDNKHKSKCYLLALTFIEHYKQISSQVDIFLGSIDPISIEQ